MLMYVTNSCLSYRLKNTDQTEGGGLNENLKKPLLSPPNSQKNKKTTLKENQYANQNHFNTTNSSGTKRQLLTG